MNGRNITLIIVGFLVGVLAAAGAGVRVIEEVRSTEDATSLPTGSVSSTTMPPDEYFVAPGETVIGSTVVVPTSVIDSGTELVVEYDLVSLAPTEGLPPIFIRNFRSTQVIENSELPVVFPRRWVLTTESGVFEGGPANTNVRVARFELPEGVNVSSIVSLEIVDPLVTASLDTHFELSTQSPTTEIIDGVSARLLNISDQGDTTIVQIELVADDPIDLRFAIEGVGAGWRSAAFAAEERPQVNLTWAGGELPETMTFRAHGLQWVELAGSFAVAIERFQ